MAFAYPVFLELAGRTCVVIGVTAVREGKVEGLVAAGASRVRVIAEGPEGTLADLESAHAPKVGIERRGWRPTDLDGAFLCVASSHDAATRSAIGREARLRGVLVNVMDDVPNCDWAAPAIVRRGDLAVAISTGGASPALARKLREELQKRFGPEWEDIIRVLRRVRDETRSRLPNPSVRARLWYEALDLREAEELSRIGRLEELEDRLRTRLLQGASV